MILHIVSDNIFVDMAYRVFETVYPGKNEFILAERNNKLKYIKNTPVDYVHRLNIIKKSFSDNLKNYEMVILHGMDDFKMQCVLKADSSIKFVWIGFGGDYYKHSILSDELLLPKTLKLKEELENFYKLNQMANKFLFKLKKLIKKILFEENNELETINKIKFFSPVLKEEFNLVKEKVPNFKPKYLSWNYGSLEDLIKGFEGFGVTEQNILLGNSASFSNNHLDAIEFLSKIDLEGKKVICPLSYGDLNYGKSILVAGNETWGKNFIPLIDFMPIDKYIELISSCSIVIMNHLRQQALGNIITMMYLGAKVFLDERNILYHFFKNEGAHVFSTQQLIDDHSLINSFLSQSEIETNKLILRRHWSREAIIQKTNRLVNIVKNHN